MQKYFYNKNSETIISNDFAVNAKNFYFWGGILWFCKTRTNRTDCPW